MQRCGFLLSVVSMAGLLPAAITSASENSSQRPFRIDDWFDAEDLRTPRFSPDGQAVVFTRRRAASSKVLNPLEIDQTRDDLWLQPAPGKEARNLTHGAKDASGAWNPQWSADGAYLSFLSSRGGEVTAWVWERRADTVRQISPAGVAFKGNGGCRWLPENKLLCAMTLDGRGAAATRGAGEAVEFASDLWQKLRQGELAMSVVDSTEFKQEASRLLRFDLAAGTSTEVATILFDRDMNTWWPSPDGKVLAYVRHEPSMYSRRERSQLGFPVNIELRGLDGQRVELTTPLPGNVLMTSVRWAQDSHAVAFFALGAAKVDPEVLYGEALAKEIQVEATTGSWEYPGKFWQADVCQGAVAEISTGDIDLGRKAQPPAFQWLASGEWLFHTTRLPERAQPHRDPKPEWWILGKSGVTRRLYRETSLSAETLESIDDGRTFMAVSNGDLWKIDASTGSAQNLTQHFAPPVVTYRLGETASPKALILRAGEPVDEASRHWARHRLEYLRWNGVDDYALDFRTGQIVEVQKPDPSALLAAFHESTRSWLYRSDDNNGTRIWRGTNHQSRQSWERLAEVNSYYASIAPPRERLLHYTTLNGEPMIAKVSFPPGYVAGRRYPVVVDSDIGYTPRMPASLFTLSPPDSSGIANVVEKIFTSAGFVYMFTSAPTRDIMDDAGRANLLLFTNGILPAVDAAIVAGFADPDRFVLFGFSSFGFGALGVVTQTSRFKAAVAASSWSDQFTFPLVLNAVRSHSDSPWEFLASKPPYTTSSLPVWRNADHYRRNSPINYVDRVRTPLLIVQHEFDHLPMSHAEMFFSALVMQRRPARFVRYFGEEHVLQSPANFRDFFRQVFAWFDRYADLQRDREGRIVFEADRAQSRNGRPPLTPEDFARFGPAAEMRSAPVTQSQ